MEKDSVRCNKICIQIWQSTTQRISVDSSTVPAKKEAMFGHDGFKRITGTKIHVAVDCNSLPVSIIIGKWPYNSLMK